MPDEQPASLAEICSRSFALHGNRRIDRLAAKLDEPILVFLIWNMFGYDAFLGEVNVLVKFKKAWVEWQVFYNQPVSCKQVGTIP